MSDEEKVKVWMPLFIGAYLADTQRLSTEQHGAYLLLIMDYWMNGAPADDDVELAQITKLSLAAWKKHRAKIAKFFTARDGQWFHKRIEKELKDAKANKEKAVTKAKKAAETRWSKHNSEQSSVDASSNATRMPQALPQAEHEAMPEVVLEQCPLPTPLPTTKTEGTNTALGEVEVGGTGERAIRAVDLSVVMRRFGIQSNPGDPRLAALAEQGVAVETVEAACEHAKRSKPNERVAAGYIVSIIERWAAEASNLKASGAKAPTRTTGQKFDPVAFVNKNRVSDNRERTNDTNDIIDI